MACIRFRRGAWGVDWRDAVGRRRWRRCGSELEAQKVLEAVSAERRDRYRPSAAGLTVSEYFELWFSEARVRVRPPSATRYRQAFEQHLRGELGGRALDSITRFELKRLLIRKHEAGGSIHMVTRMLSMLFRSAYEDGLLERNPSYRLLRTFRLEREPSPDAKALTREELHRFLGAARDEPLYLTLFRTMAFTGIRPGEARGLQVRDLAVAPRRLSVSRTFSHDRLSSSTKSGRSRLVELPAALELELQELGRFRAPEAWLFDRRGEFLRGNTVRRAFERLVERAGLPRGRFSPHSLRHTYASLLIQRGARAEYVQRQLGHSSIKLTVDLYGRWLELAAPETLTELVEAVDGNETVPDEGPPRRNVLSFRRLPLPTRGRSRTAPSDTSGDTDDEPTTEGA